MSLLGASGSLGAGDIWTTGAFSFESPLKDLLDSGNNYTTEDLLAQDELLQELRGLHPLLTQYFGTEATVTRLLRYIILGPHDPAPRLVTKTESPSSLPSSSSTPPPTPPTDEDKESETTTPQPGEWLYRYLERKSAGDKQPAVPSDPMLVHVRFPYMACEILCCELPQTIDTLVEGHVVSNNGDDDDDDDDANRKPLEASATEEAVEVVTATRPRLLDLLFRVLHDCAPGELDDYRAGYLDKILTVLFRRRPEAMTDYMNSGGMYGPAATRRAVLQHLYSYSMTQIAQRLLLPPRPKPANNTSNATNNQEGEENGETTHATESGQDILGGEEDDDMDPDMNGAGIKCDWHKCKDAIPWLLELLQGKSIGEKESVLTPEQQLAMSLNASEVFITVIQNSMLSSETMLTLTTVENWNKLIAAVLPADGEAFSSHESYQTSAMNVIESLVLQLGGYGAVGTMSLLPEEGEEGAAGAGNSSNPELSHELIADLENLLEVLPNLLRGFAQLLTHPSTKDWTSRMQFSQHTPVALLGMSRLKIVRVLESLVLLGDPEVDHCLVESNCLRLCLDLFWEFQWCSMLHQSVANLLVHVFEGQNVRYEIQEYFLVQCNLLGRLMDSFGKAEHVIEQAKQQAVLLDPTALTDSADPLPVSEEDVEAAMEVGSTTEEGGAAAASKEGTPQVSQSFRYGYMGHVIIICQALVQACTSEWETGGMEEGPDGTSGDPAGPLPPNSLGSTSVDSTAKAGDNSEVEPLMIAELVKNHELSEQWKDFVSGTLSVEITTQSTPLGGYAGPSTDPLASHRPGMELPQPGGRRPGLADDDMDMGTGPPPPRGMLGGGDTIDMDDNDLDVAAQMLSNLGLGARPNTTATCDDSDDDSGFSGSGDSEKSYNSGETNNSGGGYAFDDPLGGSGGLGIELGKLTKLGLGGGGGVKNKPAPEPKKQEDDNEDENSHSSSDEEPPRPDSDDEDDNSNGENNEDDNDNDIPVMDLFAGNFEHGQSSPGDEKPPGLFKEPDEFDAFADFDAFAGSPPPIETPVTQNLSVAATETPSLDLFVNAPPPDLDDFVASPTPAAEADDGFGDFMSADSEPTPTTATDAPKTTEGEVDPFAVDAFSAKTDAFSTFSKSSGGAAMDPFDPNSDDFLQATEAKEGDFTASGTFKTTFSGNSFDDMDLEMGDLKIAPSDELMADAAASEDSSPSDVPETVPEEPNGYSEEPEGTPATTTSEASDDASPPSDKSPKEEPVLVSSSS
eukprot:scaffold26780_cov235-Amphora_coffeaeformis.AAC.1